MVIRGKWDDSMASVCASVRFLNSPSVCLSVCLSVSLSVCLSVCLSVSLSLRILKYHPMWMSIEPLYKRVLTSMCTL